MTPDQLPIVVTPALASNNKQLTVQQQIVLREAQSHLAETDKHLTELAQDVQTQALQLHEAVGTGMVATVGTIADKASKAGIRADKQLAKLANDIRDEALDHLDRSTSILRLAGANPVLPLEEIAATNALGLHRDVAIESIILPMIEAQKNDTQEGQTQAQEAIVPIQSQEGLPIQSGTYGVAQGPSDGAAGIGIINSNPIKVQSRPVVNVPKVPDCNLNTDTGYGQSQWASRGGAWVESVSGCSNNGVPVYPCLSPSQSDTGLTNTWCKAPPLPPPLPPPPPPPPVPPQPCPAACPAPIIQVLPCSPSYSPSPSPQPSPPPSSPPYPPYPPPAPVPPVTPEEPVPPPPPPAPAPPQAPTANPLPTLPPVQFISGGASWDSFDVCMVADGYIQTTRDPGEAPTLAGTNSIWSFISSLTQFGPSALAATGTGIPEILQYVMDYGKYLTRASLAGWRGATGIDPASASVQLAGISAGGVASLFTQSPVDRVAMPLTYAWQFQTPYELPAQGDFNEMYLSNLITLEQWECWTKALGHAPLTHKLALNASQYKFGINDLTSLLLRGKLTKEQYIAECRRIGVTDPQVALANVDLNEYIPGPGDIVRFMTRDAFDEDVVAKSGLDVGFSDKYVGKLVAWGEANGISRDVMRANWRSHFILPSNTEGYEFVRRLRPGRVDKSLEFTRDDLVEMLKINDHAPGYIDKLIEISYHPINRTDVESAYISGAIQKNEVLERYRDLGYSDADAITLTRASEIKKGNQIQQSAGIWTKRRINREYIGGGLSRHDASALLAETIPDPAQVNRLLDSADLLRSVNARNKCIEGVRRRYFTGELDRIQSRNMLFDLDVDRAQQDSLLQGWTCQRESRSKEPTVKMLSEWVKDGIVSQVEFVRRLGNLGYTADDSQRILIALTIEVQKATEAAAKKSQKEMEVRQRQQRTDIRQAKKDKDAEDKKQADAAKAAGKK